MAEHDQLFRDFPLFSNGQRPDLDAIAIIVELFEEFDDEQTRAALSYLNARFAKDKTDG